MQSLAVAFVLLENIMSSSLVRFYLMKGFLVEIGLIELPNNKVVDYLARIFFIVNFKKH